MTINRANLFKGWVFSTFLAHFIFLSYRGQTNRLSTQYIENIYLARKKSTNCQFFAIKSARPKCRDAASKSCCNAASGRQNATESTQNHDRGKSSPYRGKSSPVEKLTLPWEKLTVEKVQTTEGKVQARILAVRSAPTKDLRKSVGKVRAMPRLAAGKGS